jgi:hypothetical protein
MVSTIFRRQFLVAFQAAGFDRVAQISSISRCEVMRCIWYETALTGSLLRCSPP